MNTYYIKQNNQEQGPYILDQLTNMWRQGAITADALYRVGTEGSYYPVTSLFSPPVLEENSAKLTAFEKPNAFIRVIAAMLDFSGILIIASIAGGMFGIAGMITEKFSHGLAQFFLVLNWCAFIAVTMLLCALKDGFEGRSPAKRLLGLVTISFKTREICGFGKSFARNFITIFYFILFLGYCFLIGRPIAQLFAIATVALVLIEVILLFVREDGRGLHDLAAETQVLRYKDFKNMKETQGKSLS